MLEFVSLRVECNNFSHKGGHKGGFQQSERILTILESAAKSRHIGSHWEARDEISLINIETNEGASTLP